MTETRRPEPEFDSVGLGKQLLRTVRAGTVATLDRENGFPFASLVTVATDPDGSPLFLMSRLAAHTLNLEQDRRASLLLAVNGKGDPQAHPRLTVIGEVARVGDGTGASRVRARFLARHPKALAVSYDTSTPPVAGPMTTVGFLDRKGSARSLHRRAATFGC